MTKGMRKIGLLPLLACIAQPFAAAEAKQPATTAPTGAQPVPPGYPPAHCPAPPPPAKPPATAGNDALPYQPFPATWQATIDALVAKGDIPGAVIIVKSPDWGVRVGVTGEANLVTHQKMSPDMQFRVGSVSKAFLGQVVLRLEQEGKIRLSDKVLAYLGDDKTVSGIPNIDKITVADLLQMKSGVSNYLEDTAIGFSPQITPDRSIPPEELASAVSSTGHPMGKPPVAPLFAPGDTYINPYWATVLGEPPPEPAPYPAWNYSNTNYILLGMIARKVTGMEPQDYLRRYVFDVVGLKNTYFATDARRLPQMHGYTKWGSIPYPVQVYDTWCDVTATNPSYAWTAGAIVSTPWDLLKFEDAMFASDTLLNAGTKNKWLTFVSADIHVGWEPMQYGVGGLMQAERGYGSARGHGGAFPGYKTLIYYFGDQKTSFVLASNTWDQEWEEVMLDEIMPQVSSAVTTPHPGNDAILPAGTAKLGWQAGRMYGDRYDVYWGTSQEAVDKASAEHHPGVERQTVTGLTASISVQSGKTYYWRVDTISPGQKLPFVIGPTWRFKTR